MRTFPRAVMGREQQLTRSDHEATRVSRCFPWVLGEVSSEEKSGSIGR